MILTSQLASEEHESGFPGRCPEPKTKLGAHRQVDVCM